MPPSPSADAAAPPTPREDRAEFLLVGVLAAVSAGALASGAPLGAVGAAAAGGLGLGLGAARSTGAPWGGAVSATLWAISALGAPEALRWPVAALPWLLTLTAVALRRPDGPAPLGLALCGLVLMIAPPLAAEALAGAGAILGATALSGGGAVVARVTLRAAGAALCFGALWLVLLPKADPSAAATPAPWCWALGAVGLARARHAPDAPALIGLLITALVMKIGHPPSSALLTAWGCLCAAKLVGRAPPS